MKTGEPQPRQARIRRALVCVLVVAATAVNVSGAFAAAADDPAPPATTTPTPAPAPDPTPDPAPPVVRQSAPKAKPAPPPAPTAHRWHPSSTPTRTHTWKPPARPRTQSYAHSPATTYHPRVVHPRKATVRRVHATKRHVVHKKKPAARKAKHVSAKRKALRHTKKRAAAPTIVRPKPARHVDASNAASLPLPAPSRSSAGRQLGLTSLFIVLALLGAIACFTAALVPATYMRWRPAVIFASERHIDLTIAGIGLLTVTAFIVIVTNGF